jgi:cytochrome c-type biogenesis protein CcsB
MKFLNKIFLSIESMVFMMFVFAASIGVATFIENDYGTESAKVAVYNAKWFEALLVLLAINLVVNIYRYKMWQIGKRLSLLFHVSFIVILLGAGTTRYVGFEGTMHIREGGVSNIIESSEAFLEITATQNDQVVEKRKKLLMSPMVKSPFREKVSIADKTVVIKYADYYVNAGEQIVAVENGKPLVQVMVSQNNNPQNVILEKDDVLNFSHFVLSFGETGNGPLPSVRLNIINGELFFNSNSDVTVTSMADQSTTTLESGVDHAFGPMTLYSVGPTYFVLRQFVPSGELQVVPVQTEGGMGPGKQTINALVVEVSTGTESKKVNLIGGRGVIGDVRTVTFGETQIDLKYGSIEIGLPFSLELVEFQIDRYPGSNSPSSYASKVILKDEEKGLDGPFRIYMNHILQHRGFRFFQSSYDQDELGTILSVSYDPGTFITYIGYILLAFALGLNFLNRKSRFRKLSNLLKDTRAQKAALAFVAFLVFNGAVDVKAQEPNPAIISSISADHAEKFGHLLVQDSQGRIKPITTLGFEILNKVTRKSSINGLDVNQVLLGMLVQPAEWQKVDMIKIKHPVLKTTLGLAENDKYANFGDFFDPHNRQYKLSNPVEGAKRKRPSMHDKFDKEIIKVDERLSICYMLYVGQLYRIFPKENDSNNSWISHKDASQLLNKEEANSITGMMATYTNAVNSALLSGNWELADAALLTIKNYQKKLGHEVYPSDKKINAEIYFHNLNIFSKLAVVYLLTGIILLVVAFIKVFRHRSKFKITSHILFGALALGFVGQTFGLILRWYVSGHAPWSNGYESMIYIAWATVLAGFIFSKREPMPMAATTVLAGLILFVAHLNWMDPQITNLVPVLKSYWLMIHVSMITASYGFLGLGALLAFLTLLIFSFKTRKNAERVELSIKELSMINEQTITLGLILLTIGNFLGAVWANESWGRYWGWDPKETWALVTILVYSALIHFRLIPKLKSFYAFNVGALFAFGTVIMTYFGVNYYLSGLHSYAQGDPVPVPKFVYYIVATVILVSLTAFRSRKMGDIE